MGIIVQGILGGVSGKVGPVIGSSWKGIHYLKSVPVSVANPRTAAQVAQREKFANVVAFAKEILSSVLKPLRDRFAVKMSGFNSFVSDNIDLFAAEMASPAADLIIASGKMAVTTIDTLTATSGASAVENIWTNDSGSGFKLSDDIPYSVFVNETTEEIVFSDASGSRAEGTDVSDFSVNLEVGDVVHSYLNFLRADGTVVSNTSYKTKTVT